MNFYFTPNENADLKDQNDSPLWLKKKREINACRLISSFLGLRRSLDALVSTVTFKCFLPTFKTCADYWDWGSFPLLNGHGHLKQQKLHHPLDVITRELLILVYLHTKARQIPFDRGNVRNSYYVYEPSELRL